MSVFNDRYDVALGRPVALELVGHEDSGDVAQSLEQFAEEALGSFPILTGLQQNIERVAILIHGPPKIVVLAVLGQDDFVQVPLVPAVWLPAKKSIGIGLAELERPMADGFMADNDPAIRQDFFHVPEAQRKPEVQPYGVADDFNWIPAAEVNCRSSDLI